MRIIPAIDLQGGKCVRLYQGDFEKITEYSDDPVSIARRYAELDVQDLHVVDLDGARTGEQTNTGLVRKIAAASPFDVQLGGGIRSRSVLQHWFANGVERCVIGSLAVSDPVEVIGWMDEFGADRIVLALDVVIGDDGLPRLAAHGWTTTTRTILWDCVDEYRAAGLQHVLCTDISRDGAMSGPNIELYADIVVRYPGINLQASGGVRNKADLSALRDQSIPAAITGRALLDGAISADEVASFRHDA